MALPLSSFKFKPKYKIENRSLQENGWNWMKFLVKTYYTIFWVRVKFSNILIFLIDKNSIKHDECDQKVKLKRFWLFFNSCQIFHHCHFSAVSVQAIFSFVNNLKWKIKMVENLTQNQFFFSYWNLNLIYTTSVKL